MTGIGQLAVQSPEAADKALCMLGHRLGEITSRRGDRPDDGHRTVLPGQGSHGSGPLVEFGDPRGQVGGKTLLRRHLLHTSRQLPQCLRPAGGGIRHHGHIKALIAIVLRQGHTGVDRGLPGGNGHVRGVGDQHGSLHQASSGTGVDELGKLAQHVGHLVSPLAAADVDDDLRVAPFGDGVLDHGLPRSESSGDGHGAPPGHGKQGIDDPLPRDQGPASGRQAFGHGPGSADRPALHHGDPPLSAFGLHQSDRLLHGVLPFHGQGFQCALHIGGQQDALLHPLGFLDRADHRPSADFCSHGKLRRTEQPLLLPVQRGRADAPLDEVPRQLKDPLQRALDTVVDRSDQSGSELDEQGAAGTEDVVSWSDAGGILVDLDDRPIPGQLDDLPDQAHLPHPHQLQHHGVADSGGFDDRSVDPVYLSDDSFFHNTSCICFRISDCRRCSRVATWLLNSTRPSAAFTTTP